MKKRAVHIIVAALIFIIGVVITLVVSFNNLTKKSFYKESGSVKISGIKDEVSIYKDSYGVSHIQAKNEEDMYFALGYIHSQDRLFQMDLFRRICEGRLSEIFGKETLEYDKLFRTIGINRTADYLYENISQKSKSILENYSAGINYFVKSNNSKLPLEFDVMDYKPEEWTPQNSLMVVRLLGWELNLSWYTDYTFGELVKRFGIERARDFFPDYPEDAPFIVNSGKEDTKKETDKKNADNIDTKNVETGYKYLAELGADYSRILKDYRKFFGIEGTHIGSNSWVVNGTKSETKKPLLANDPHLGLSAPSKWYEVQLYNEETEINISGFSLPGAPGVVIGKNQSIGWGITNLMNDDADFYVLQRDTADYNSYILKEKVYPLDSALEYIKIKGEKEELPITIYRTLLGPVISDLENTGHGTKLNFRQDKAHILTFKWTGFDKSDEVRAVYEINNAQNWSEFTGALKNFGLPASNFTYADTSGNIGYHSAGNIPIRKNLQNEYSPVYPSQGELDWAGYVPFEELPSVYNPHEGYIVTANNKPKKDFKYYISNLYEPYYRAVRIDTLLKLRNNFTAAEFQLMQKDVYSVQGKELYGYILEAFKDTNTVSAEEKTILKLLKNWDYNLGAFSVPASVICEFEIRLYKNIYEDKLGEELLKRYMYLNNVIVRNTSRILKDEKHWLFDDMNTPRKVETRNEIIRKSFKDAIEALKIKFGNSDFSKWYWGDIHKVLIQHSFGSVTALKSIVNIGPYDLGGSGTTVANCEYSFERPMYGKDFESYLGQSLKFVCDLSNMNLYYSSIPGGQSGQPLHENYRDQIRMWMNGDYKTIFADIQKLKDAGYKLLLLYPGE